MNALISRRRAIRQAALAGVAMGGLRAVALGAESSSPAATPGAAGAKPSAGATDATAATGTAAARSAGQRHRPKLIVFDVIETLFDPTPIDAAMVELGLAKGSLKIWFPRFLRDAFALEILGEYRPFREIAAPALKVLARDQKVEVTDAQVTGVLSKFATLPAHPDVKAGFEAVRAAGVRMITLTNGAAEVTRKMLANAGLDSFIERGISIDEVQHWKPSKAVYLHAAKTMGLEPHQMALVAAHDWDTAGASRAGLTTGGVIRGSGFSAALPPPDVLTDSLPETVKRLLALPE